MSVNDRLAMKLGIEDTIRQLNRDMEGRFQSIRSEFLARKGRVYFAHPSGEGSLDIESTEMLISSPGPGAAEELAAALNRTLTPYRSYEKKAAEQTADEAKAKVASLMDELAAYQLKWIDAALLGDLVKKVPIYPKYVEAEPDQAEDKANVLAAASEQMMARN